MSEPLDQQNLPEKKEPEIVVNEYGETRDPAVVVEESDRTVLLTPDETIVIDKDVALPNKQTDAPSRLWSDMNDDPATSRHYSDVLRSSMNDYTYMTMNDQE